MSTLVSLDTVTFIKCALGDEHYEWLKNSAAVLQLWQASLLLVTTLEPTFLPGGTNCAEIDPALFSRSRTLRARKYRNFPKRAGRLRGLYRFAHPMGFPHLSSRALDGI